MYIRSSERWNGGRAWDSMSAPLTWLLTHLLNSPAHVLSDLVDRILENRLERCAQPHRKAPVPLEEHRKAMIPVCTLPFLADVEVAAAIWEPLLFPILSPKLPAVGDIRRFSVKLRLVHQTARKCPIRPVFCLF